MPSALESGRRWRIRPAWVGHPKPLHRSRRRQSPDLPLATVSRPIGGVLCLPCGSGGHPSKRPTWGLLLIGADGPPMSHAWPCSGWGLHSRPGHPGRWCALAAPFHPCLCGPKLAIGGLLSVARPAGRPDWPLASTLPCGAPTFLDMAPTAGPCRGHPADSPSPSSLPGSSRSSRAPRPPR